MRFVFCHFAATSFCITDNASYCFAGLLPPTSGTVVVAGTNLATDASEARKKAGICPQHDALWASLTAEEHLVFYGRVKGLQGSALQAAIWDKLQGVGLSSVKDKRVGTFR